MICDGCTHFDDSNLQLRHSLIRPTTNSNVFGLVRVYKSFQQMTAFVIFFPYFLFLFYIYNIIYIMCNKLYFIRNGKIVTTNLF